MSSSILFIFSGVNFGKYIFEQNPEDMDIMSPKQNFTKLPLLEEEDIYNRSLNDNEIRKMSWSVTSYSNYSGLKNYATRDISGVIPTTYFWDGTVYEFQGTPIQVIDVYGEPIASNYNKWKVEVQFKPTSLFDNKKVIL